MHLFYLDKMDTWSVKKAYSGNCKPFLFFGAPEEIRTPDPLVRSQVLYPAELRAREEWIIRESVFISSRKNLI